jgi:hypothetical protein
VETNGLSNLSFSQALKEAEDAYLRSACGVSSSTLGGKPDYILQLIDKIRNLYLDKNHDYAGKGSPYGNFERVAAILKLYPGFPYDSPAGVAMVYSLKQVDAVLHGLSEHTIFKVEGLTPRLLDIAVYALLEAGILGPNQPGPLNGS